MRISKGMTEWLNKRTFSSKNVQISDQTLKYFKVRKSPILIYLDSRQPDQNSPISEDFCKT